MLVSKIFKNNARIENKFGVIFRILLRRWQSEATKPKHTSKPEITFSFSCDFRFYYSTFKMCACMCIDMCLVCECVCKCICTLLAIYYTAQFEKLVLLLHLFCFFLHNASCFVLGNSEKLYFLCLVFFTLFLLLKTFSDLNKKFLSFFLNLVL